MYNEKRGKNSSKTELSTALLSHVEKLCSEFIIVEATHVLYKWTHPWITQERQQPKQAGQSRTIE